MVQKTRENWLGFGLMFSGASPMAEWSEAQSCSLADDCSSITVLRNWD